KRQTSRTDQDVDLGERSRGGSRRSGESQDQPADCREDCSQSSDCPQKTGQYRHMNWFKNVWKEFKEFAIKGNAVDLAIGVIIGAAFSGIITSLVKDIITPPISLLSGGLDFSNKFVVLRAAKAGSTAFNTPADAV